MLLGSADGALVGLRPVSYQFPGHASTRPGRDWDANWLVIRGEVRHRRVGGSRLPTTPCGPSSASSNEATSAT
jgi:hypothetical protein